MVQVNEAIEKHGIAKILGLGTALLGLAVFGFFMINKVSTPELSLLYADLDMADGGRIASRLEGMGIPYEAKGGGTQIFAPLDQIAKIRMDLAEAGIPSGGSIGYEIFDKGDNLGTTSFVQNINRIRALEGELSRTVKTIGSVAAARVHLVLPNKSVFSRDKEEARASIVLKLHGPGRLTRNKVAAIQHLVSSGVPGLSPDRISIVDDRGTLLLKGDKSGTGAFPSDIDEARFEYERRLASSIETLIARTVGMGKVRAEITADLDFDRITESQEIFDPESQVVRQSNNIEEGQDAQEGTARAVSAGENVPQKEESAGGDSKNQQKSNKIEESVTFEISKTLRNHIHESGGIKRLSVAVVVDGSYTTTKEGEEKYAPRTPEEMENIKKLVRSTIGFNEKRGDQIEVINMRFAPDNIAENIDEPAFFLGMERHHIMRIVELLLIIVFGLLALKMVVSPLLASFLSPVQRGQGPLIESKAFLPSPPERPGAFATSESDSTDQFTPKRNPQDLVGDAGDLKNMIEMQQVQGKVRASSVKKIGNMVDERTDEAVNIIRNWLNG